MGPDGLVQADLGFQEATAVTLHSNQRVSVVWWITVMPTEWCENEGTRHGSAARKSVSGGLKPAVLHFNL